MIGGPYRVPGEVLADREPEPVALAVATPAPEMPDNWENAADGMAFIGRPRIAASGELDDEWYQFRRVLSQVCAVMILVVLAYLLLEARGLLH